MSIAIAEPRQTNPHVESLQQLLTRTETPVKCLVIAHHDTSMIRRLEDAMQSSDGAILQIEQADWESSLPQLVAIASSFGVSQVLVVGQYSEADAVPPTGPTGNPEAARSTPYNELLEAARKTEQQLANAKQQFAQTVSRLAERNEAGVSQQTHQIQILGLFYVATSGMFLRYDTGADRFHSLGTAF